MLPLKTNCLKLIPFSIELAQTTLQNKLALMQLLNVREPIDWPGPDFAEIIPLIINALLKDPDRGTWEMLIIHQADRAIIGDVGFKGKPNVEGTVEIGYSIIPAYRRKGYAFEVAQALIQWACYQPKVKQIVAECEPTNLGSICILEKLGFQPLDSEKKLQQWFLSV